MSDTILTPTPTPVQLRAMLEEMVVNDLLGPAGGPEEELTERNVRDRYLVGVLAPRPAPQPAAAAKVAEEEEDDEETPLIPDELSEGGTDTADDGTTDRDVPLPRAALPSSFGMSFCVDRAATALQVEARWGQYLRVKKEDQIDTRTGRPLRIWKRQPRGGVGEVEFRSGADQERHLNRCAGDVEPRRYPAARPEARCLLNVARPQAVITMPESWPAICTAVALALLLVLIIRYQLNAFVALLVVSLGLGLAAGMPPSRVVASIGAGLGKILAGVAILLALGAMLGRMLDVSGAAEVITRTLINAFGAARASLAVLAAAYLIGIPILFNVGFLLLIPIVWRLQRDTNRSLLYFGLPLAFSLGITHSLVPPHPGIVGAVANMAPPERAGAVMVQTILFGSLMGVPLVLLGWLGPGLWWARRQFVTPPEHLAAKVGPKTEESVSAAPPSFAVSVLIVTLPLGLSLVGFGADLFKRLDRLPGWVTQPLFGLGHPPLDWLMLLGHPTMALLVPTLLAFALLGLGRGMGLDRLSKLAGDSLQDVGTIAFLFGAAGGFAQVIQDCGAGTYIAEQASRLPLSPVLVCFVVAVLMRIALGSATASILIASSLLQGFARSQPGQEALLVLAVANGVTFMTQPADSGFWMVKEYFNLSVRDVLVRFNACRIPMSLAGLGLLLVYEQFGARLVRWWFG